MLSKFGGLRMSINEDEDEEDEEDGESGDDDLDSDE